MHIKPAQSWGIALVLGLLGTIQYHLAQFTSRFDTVFGDRGDMRGVIYFCEHWYLWLIGKTDLMSPAIFYPTKHTLAYSDYLVGLAIPYAGARMLGFGMFSSMEIVIILLTFLNYVACYVLLKHVLNFKLLPACAAAMFFAFSSPKFLQLPHLQLQFVVLLPLIFACVVLFVRKSEELKQREAAGWLTAGVILFIFQAATAFYFSWFLVFWTLLFALPALLLTPSRRLIFSWAQKYWRPMLAAGIVLFVGGAFFVLSYLPGLRMGQWYRYDFVSQMIPSWWSFVWMGDGNYLWGWLSGQVVPNPRPSTWNELRVGIGLVPTAAWLAVMTWLVWRLRSQKNDPSSAASTGAFLTATVLATTLFILIGFSYHNHSPWFFVYNYFPGGKAIRAVARYVIFLTLPMAIVFAFLLERGLRWAAKQKSERTRTAVTAAIVLIGCIGVFEQFGVPKVNGTGFSKKAEEAYLNSMAAKLPGDCNAFYIAPGKGNRNPAEYQYDAMLISIRSGVPTLNASSSQFPPGWDLYTVGDPNYEVKVKEWIQSQAIKGKVCRLEVGPQVEAFDPHGPSPLDDASFFVRQQFRDFGEHEPSEQQLQPWIEKTQQCTRANSCDRAQIALDIFRATGFAEDGAFIYRAYQVALGRAPTYAELTADLNVFRATSKNKSTFTDTFANRNEFVGRYASVPNDGDYVTKLIENSGAGLSKEALPKLTSGGETRAQTLLEVLDNPEVVQTLTDRAFVTLHYFGYLRRDPDADGFSGWVKYLAKTKDLERLTAGFVNSLEYRQRFIQ
ncbi:MAG TPA: DUF4214 domain-containing protein [Pyrinomonadaceae bacterium]|nr:DUF4214 domain-containing protein [Pyrinomonadaceae bacterium]